MQRASRRDVEPTIVGRSLLSPPRAAIIPDDRDRSWKSVHENRTRVRDPRRRVLLSRFRAAFDICFALGIYVRVRVIVLIYIFVSLA